MPIRPSVVGDVVTELRQIDQQFENIERMAPGPERTEKLRALEVRAGLSRQKFRQRFARVLENEQALLDAKHQLSSSAIRRRCDRDVCEPICIAATVGSR